MRLLFAASALALSLLACAPAQEPAPQVTYAPVEAPIAGGAPRCPHRSTVEAQKYEKEASEGQKPVIGGPVGIEIGQIVQFCAKNHENPLCEPISGRKMTLAEANAVDSWLRSQFEYTDDDLTHGTSDFWDGDTVCGDCEDYALTLALYLAKKGQAGPSMWLAVGYPGWIGGHATLLVDTSDYGVVEYTVGGTPGANVYDPDHQPVRLGTIQMNGKLEIATYEGVTVIQAAGRIILQKNDTRDDARRAGLLKD